MQGTTAKKKGFSILDAIEKVGNKLPILIFCSCGCV